MISYLEHHEWPSSKRHVSRHPQAPRHMHDRLYNARMLRETEPTPAESWCSFPQLSCTIRLIVHVSKVVVAHACPPVHHPCV